MYLECTYVECSTLTCEIILTKFPLAGVLPLFFLNTILPVKTYKYIYICADYNCIEIEPLISFSYSCQNPRFVSDRGKSLRAEESAVKNLL